MSNYNYQRPPNAKHDDLWEKALYEARKEYEPQVASKQTALKYLGEFDSTGQQALQRTVAPKDEKNFQMGALARLAALRRAELSSGVESARGAVGTAASSRYNELSDERQQKELEEQERQWRRKMDMMPYQQMTAYEKANLASRGSGGGGKVPSDMINYIDAQWKAGTPKKQVLAAAYVRGASAGWDLDTINAYISMKYDGGKYQRPVSDKQRGDVYKMLEDDWAGLPYNEISNNIYKMTGRSPSAFGYGVESLAKKAQKMADSGRSISSIRNFVAEAYGGGSANYNRVMERLKLPPSIPSKYLTPISQKHIQLRG
jgi:hypothetical protein